MQKLVEIQKLEFQPFATNPSQTPLDTRQEGEWWAMMEEVFHHD